VRSVRRRSLACGGPGLAFRGRVGLAIGFSGSFIAAGRARGGVAGVGPCYPSWCATRFHDPGKTQHVPPPGSHDPGKIQPVRSPATLGSHDRGNPGCDQPGGRGENPAGAQAGRATVASDRPGVLHEARRRIRPIECQPRRHAQPARARQPATARAARSTLSERPKLSDPLVTVSAWPIGRYLLRGSPSDQTSPNSIRANPC
jgi:hypothetical protein